MNSKYSFGKLILTAYSNTYFNGSIPKEIINYCIYLYYSSRRLYISSGFDKHCFIYDSDIYTWDCKTFSPEKLNLPNVTIHNRISKLRTIAVALSFGKYHQIVLTERGHIYTEGLNDYGQLGLGHLCSTYFPTKVNLNGVIEVSCGEYHTMALNIYGEVYAWGLNSCDQLGTGYYKNKNIPHIINLPPIKKIKCGEHHALAITTTNELYSWGQNYYGQLGLGDCKSHKLPQKVNLVGIIDIACSGSKSMALDISGTAYIWGSFRVSPIEIKFNTIKAISCSAYCYIFLDTMGRVYERDSDTILIQEDIFQPAVMISSGRSHSTAITKSGDVYTWSLDMEIPLKINFNQSDKTVVCTII